VSWDHVRFVEGGGIVVPSTLAQSWMRCQFALMETSDQNETDGLEFDEGVDEGASVERIDNPFDPSQIKVNRKVIPINLIVERISHDEIDLAPEFQRRARIWDKRRKSRLIESILLRIPLPVFYVSSDSEDNWQVVDGLQRLTTIYDFISEESKFRFNLSGLEYLVSYEGMGFDDLPRSIMRRINETELNVNVIEYGTPDPVMFNIFSRLNTGGMSLNSQEIRNALHPGPVRDFLKALAGDNLFSKATAGSVRDDRMGARELALRFCAFYMTDFRRYGSMDLDSFLNDAMKNLNSMSKFERSKIQKAFQLAMDRSWNLFGDNAFRKLSHFQERRSPVNRALFETVSVNLGKLSDNQFRVILNEDGFFEQFVDLFDDERFLKSISLSTGGRHAVDYRFGILGNLIMEFINDN
jgi:hypothetical protein